MSLTYASLKAFFRDDDQLYLSINQCYNMTDKMLDVAHRFAKDSIETNYLEWFRRHSELSKSKAIDDCMAGKIGEMGLRISIKHSMTKRHNQIVLKDVDFRVLERKRKSFDPDMTWGVDSVSVGVSVKTSYHMVKGKIFSLDKQLLGHSESQYSYTFQNQDSFFYCVNSGRLSHICAFCIYEPENHNVIVSMLVKPQMVFNMLVLPIKKKLWSNKRCIMHNTCLTETGFPCGLEELEGRINNGL